MAVTGSQGQSVRKKRELGCAEFYIETQLRPYLRSEELAEGEGLMVG